jgi:hypothetical protein
MVPASVLVLDQFTVTVFPTKTEEGAALMTQVRRVWARAKEGVKMATTMSKPLAVRQKRFIIKSYH